MTISNNPARILVVLAVAVGLVLPTGFGPARAVESQDTDRGNGDQTQTQTATPANLKRMIASAKKPAPSRSGVRFGRRKVLVGTASYYGSKFHGRRTYTGERYNMHAMTLACRRLPMGTRVRVTNLRTGKSAVGRVNDYGPNGRFRNRVADLSVGLARKIGFRPSQGLTKVRMEVVK
jgi:rare lipoprotein A (peptidoglycan hydrolase)